jgi:ketosteroid isomerase-like protein
MDVDEIQRLEDKRYAAMLGKDVATLDRLLHDDLVYMHLNGVADTKASYIAGLLDGVSEYRRIERSDVSIKIHPHAALVFSRLSMSVTVRAQAREVEARVLVVWTPSGDNIWRLIGVQSGAIPPHLK